MKKHNLSLNYLHAFLIILVVIFHSLMAYEKYIPPITSAFTSRPFVWAVFPVLDAQRSAGFTMLIVFCDHFFMPLLFFISGLFLWRSISEKGAAGFLKERIIRLGVPFIIVKYLVIPFAYYPAYLILNTEHGFTSFIKTWITLGNYPSGPVWFLSLLLLFGILTMISYKFFPGWGASLGRKLGPLFERPVIFFILFASVSAGGYLLMSAFFNRYHWVNTPLLNFQTTRVLLYAVYLVTGIAAGCYGLDRGLLAPEGRLARRWRGWLLSVIIMFPVMLTSLGKTLVNPSSMMYKNLYGILFAVFSASCLMFFTGFFIRFAKRRYTVIDSLHQNAYGIFLIHYFFVVWLQYSFLHTEFSALMKGLLAAAGAVSLSWIFTAAVRRIPAINMTISPGDSIFGKTESQKGRKLQMKNPAADFD